MPLTYTPYMAGRVISVNSVVWGTRARAWRPRACYPPKSHPVSATARYAQIPGAVGCGERIVAFARSLARRPSDPA